MTESNASDSDTYAPAFAQPCPPPSAQLALTAHTEISSPIALTNLLSNMTSRAPIPAFPTSTDDTRTYVRPSKRGSEPSPSSRRSSTPYSRPSTRERSATPYSWPATTENPHSPTSPQEQERGESLICRPSSSSPCTSTSHFDGQPAVKTVNGPNFNGLKLWRPRELLDHASLEKLLNLNDGQYKQFQVRRLEEYCVTWNPL
jgi:hypothetical protein